MVVHSGCGLVFYASLRSEICLLNHHICPQSVFFFRIMKSMAKRVAIFVDPVSQHSTSEESLVACVERKSVGRRRSSSLDAENGKQINRKSLAEQLHVDRKVVYSGVETLCISAIYIFGSCHKFLDTV